MSNPKNYKELVDNLQSIALSHIAVKQTGVGELSDIDVETNTKNPARYPLVFFVPQTSTIDRFGSVIFGFSMIVADIAKNQESLSVDAHNLTFGIMQDIISKIILSGVNTIGYDLETPISITPFVERFKNNLCGWTAELNVKITSPLDLCNSAFI